MARRRYYRRTGKKAKYSIEQTMINTPANSTWPQFAASLPSLAASRQIGFSVIPPTDVTGMRKVKHFTLSFNGSSDLFPCAYALVYVPEGYEPQRLNLPEQNYAFPLYDANQFIISSGVLDFSGGPLRIRSPLSRNLNSGDSIYLLLATYEGVEDFTIIANISYAITLQ